MFLIDPGARDIDGVPILDRCTVAEKTAEMLVDLHRLGIRRSGKGLFAEPGADRAKLRKLYE